MKNTDFVYFFSQPSHRTIGRTERNGFIEQTTEHWICRWRYKGQIRVLTVPCGYIWDGASIPRAAWTIIGLTPGGLADGPSLAHDPLYRSTGGRVMAKFDGCTLVDEDNNRVIVDRPEADWVFLEACKYAGINRIRAGASYGVVRAFGKIHWGAPCPTKITSIE